MSDDAKKRQNSEQEIKELSEHICNEEIMFPRHAQNSLHKAHDDDGTKETIRNRNSNIEES